MVDLYTDAEIEALLKSYGSASHTPAHYLIAIPRLVRELQWARAALRKLVATLDGPSFAECQICGGIDEHDASCTLALARAVLPKDTPDAV